MRYDKEHLLSLIPAIYKIRDYVREEAPHGPLEALIEAIADQVSGLDLNIDQLYDDLFIETCADWVIPYIGDMIGYRPLSGAKAAVSSPRAEVANTINYRRRKGTLTVIELLAHDVTGWPAVALECYTKLAQTEYMNHIRPNRNSTVSLREPLPSLSDQPLFLDMPHTVDVRRINSRRGIWNIPNIAIYLYRLAEYNVLGGTPAALSATHYMFHPLGLDAPLFQPVRPQSPDQARPERPQDVPVKASRRRLAAELDNRRARIAAGDPAPVLEEQAVGFTAANPVLRISVGGVPIDPRFIKICDLSTWTPSTLAGIQATVDPVLGRFILANDPMMAPLSVDYWYGFPGDFGAGPYSFPDPVAPVNVVAGADLSAAIAAALALGNADVRVPDSYTFPGDLSIAIPAKLKLTLRAGSRNRPAIGGALKVDLGADSSFTLIGFVVANGVEVSGGPGAVDIQQSTLMPSGGSAVNWIGAAGGTLQMERTLSGGLLVDPLIAISVSESLINAGSDTSAAISATMGGNPAGALTLDTVTVIGRIDVREIELMEDSLLTGTVTSTRTQAGCVRFTYLPRTSVTPHRYQCQPETAVRLAVDAAKKAGATAAQITALDDAVTARVQPEFTSLNIANPAYGQLGPRCADEIRSGAEDGLEMGIYRSLAQIQKESNLRVRLAEYLRIGLEAGIFYAD